MFTHPRPNPAAAPRRFRLFALIALLLVLLPGTLVLPSAAPAHATRAALTVADGSLIRDSSNGRIYIVWANRRHWIDSPSTLSALGYDGTSYQNLDSQTIATIQEGTVLSLHTVAGGLVWPYEAITASPVHLQLGVPSVVPGQTLRVDGSGFFANESVTLSGPQGESRTVNADGHGSFSIDFTIAAGTSLGLQRIFAQGASSGLFCVQVFHTIAGNSAAITATPNPIGLGNSLSVTGTGFHANENVQLFLAGGVATTTVTANGSGGFGPVSLAVSSSISLGSHTVRAFGTSSYFCVSISVNVQQASAATATATQPATATHTSTPVPQATQTPTAQPTQTPTRTPVPAGAAVLVVTPGTVAHDERVQLAGSGFVAGEAVVIRVDGTFAFSSQADSSGHFTAYYVANISLGSHTVTATGASGRVGSGQFTVVAQGVTTSIVLSIQQAHRGSVVYVSGAGFQAGETVLIRFSSTVVQSAQVDANGRFAGARFVVPGYAAYGFVTIKAQGQQSGRVATFSLRIIAVAQHVSAKIEVSSTTAHRGDQIKVYGQHFFAHELVLVFFRGVLVGQLHTGGAGDFGAVRFSVASNCPYGYFPLVVTGTQSNRSVRVYVHIVAAAHGKQHKKGHTDLAVSPATVKHNARVTVRGQGFQAGEVVLIRLRGRLIEAPRANSHGSIGFVFRVSGGAWARGRDLVQAVGSRSGRHAQVTLVVY